MKKTYMTPAISVMAMETAAILADSTGIKTTIVGARPEKEPTTGYDVDGNQFSKEHTFDAWED